MHWVSNPCIGERGVFPIINCVIHNVRLCLVRISIPVLALWKGNGKLTVVGALWNIYNARKYASFKYIFR